MSKTIPPIITLNSSVQLKQLSKQVEDGVAIIGRNGQFLELPQEGLQFIDWLNAGLTVSEARQRFEATFNPFPDDELMAVMDAFLEHGFIASVDGSILVTEETLVQDDTGWVSQEWAQRLFSTPMLIGWLLFVTPAICGWVVTPGLWPQYRDYFWIEYNFIIILVGLLVWLVHMFLHELFHLVAARAKGISATITWTQRVGFIPMSQTIMHDIWAVPRTHRFLPLAAGMVFDLFYLSILLYLLLGHTYQLFTLPLIGIQFLKFLALSLILAVTAQFWLFSKMDGYFLLSAILGQRNLQSDTYHWLRSKIQSTSTFIPPPTGMRYIYIYTVITVGWGVLFVGQFLLISIPIKLRLIWESILKISFSTGYPFIFADGVATLTSQGIDIGLLIYAYWRDTLPTLRKT